MVGAVKKTIFSVILGLFFFASCINVEVIASATEKTFKIYMVLWNGDDSLSKGFKDYLKGRGIKADYIVRDCQQDRQRCHALVSEIRREKPDLIFTWGTPTCEEIAGKYNAPNKEEYIRDIPIVGLIITDPVRAGIIPDLEKTQRNVTGVNHVAPVKAHLEGMLSYRHQITKIAVLYNPAETNSKIMAADFVKECEKNGIKGTEYPVALDDKGKPIPDSIKALIEKMHENKEQFIYMPADTFLSSQMKTVVAVSLEHKLPTFGTTESMFFNGNPLMGILSRFYDVGLMGGLKAAQILLEGKNPGEIRYETLGKFSLLLSPSVFKQLKIYPPLSLLKYAEIVPDQT